MKHLSAIQHPAALDMDRVARKPDGVTVYLKIGVGQIDP
jgi:hypothetical protein